MACSLNIDDTLEEIPGVFESQTSYARAETRVRIDPSKVTVKELKKGIEKVGYGVI